MIPIDAGPLVALFDPSDGAHTGCVDLLRTIQAPVVTTTCVLTEVLHLLSPASRGARSLMDFIGAGGLQVRELDGDNLTRAFELMVQYADAPMDLADASLVVMAERLKIRRIFTLDRNDFLFGSVPAIATPTSKSSVRAEHIDTGGETVGSRECDNQDCLNGSPSQPIS